MPTNHLEMIKIYFSFLGSIECPDLKEENESSPEWNKDALVLKAARDLSVPNHNVFRGSWIYSGPQRKIICSNQVQA